MTKSPKRLGRDEWRSFKTHKPPTDSMFLVYVGLGKFFTWAIARMPGDTLEFIHDVFVEEDDEIEIVAWRPVYEMAIWRSDNLDRYRGCAVDRFGDIVYGKKPPKKWSPQDIANLRGMAEKGLVVLPPEIAETNDK